MLNFAWPRSGTCLSQAVAMLNTDLGYAVAHDLVVAVAMLDNISWPHGGRYLSHTVATLNSIS